MERQYNYHLDSMNQSDRMSVGREAEELLQNLFTEQALGVLATVSNESPHASLIVFVSTNDLSQMAFATAKGTRKFKDMISNPEVAFLLDNRKNDISDFREGVAVTAHGSVREPKGEERRKLMELYINKHPYLNDFVSSPRVALMVIDVLEYSIVSQFQNVMKVNMNRP